MTAFDWVFRAAYQVAALAAAAVVAAVLAVAPAASQPASTLGALPPPPAQGTPADAADWAGVTTTFTPGRIAQADRDQALDPFLAFDGVLGSGFQYDALPETRRLLGAVGAAVGQAITADKDIFPRTRPYAVDENLARCPIGFLIASRSYPSGHAAFGAAWATVLAVLVPSRADALVARGTDYGLSRVVCGVHWPSDVAAGQAIGAAIAEEILADPTFARQLQRAEEEMAPFG